MRQMWCVFILTIILIQTVNAQVDTLLAVPKNDSVEMSKLMDVCDLAEKVFKTRLRIAKVNQNVDGPFFTILPSPGYSVTTGVTGVLAGDISFYSNKKEKGNLSFFTYNFQYSQYKQVLTQSLSTLFFGHDKWQLNGDWRYFNFPTYTWGLGSFTTDADMQAVDYSYLRMYETVLYRIGTNILAGAGYNLDYYWNIRYGGQNIIPPTGALKYGVSPQSISSGPTLNLIYDSRDDIHSPTTGSYYSFQFGTYQKALGSSSNYNSIIIDCRQYFKMPTRQRSSSLAFRAYVWLTPGGTCPYLDLPYTGGDTYNTMARGYAEGRYRGPGLLYFEAEYRFAIMKNELVGGVIFANLQSVSQWPDNNFAGCLPGAGIGLRVKLNKFSHTNFAADYGVGIRGARGFSLDEYEAY
jgi:outer membrane protein assembly factor BamA